MANNLEKVSLYLQQLLDQQVEQQSTSGWMEGNAGDVIYNGGRDIKIPILTMDGLADYDRNNGFTAGAVTLGYQTKTMEQDRGRAFSIDEIDLNEAGFIPSAAKVMSEFQRLHVISEIDAFRYAKVANIAEGAGQSQTETLSVSNALDLLRDQLAALEDGVGTSTNFIITMSATTLNLINKDPRFSNLAESTVLSQGGLNLNLTAINGNPIRVVPQNRLYNSILLNDGKTDGQTEGGYKPSDDAKKINWLISSHSAPIAVSKQDKMRIFDPETNQKARSWAMDYRRFHDLWVNDNAAKQQLFVSLAANN